MGDGEDRGELRAAGALLWRHGRDGTGVEVAIVHRPRYDDWSFPKGKMKPGEHPLVNAVREVAEETGVRAVLGRPLGWTRYRVSDRPQREDYWAATPQPPPVAGQPDKPACQIFLNGAAASRAHDGFVPGDEVDKLEWLGAEAALERLSYEHDAAMLRQFAAGPAATVPYILLRHASAGRKGGGPRDDRLRPLDDAGVAQAAGLATLLACFGAMRPLSRRRPGCGWPDCSPTGPPRSCAGTARPCPSSSRRRARISARQRQLTPRWTRPRSGSCTCRCRRLERRAPCSNGTASRNSRWTPQALGSMSTFRAARRAARANASAARSSGNRSLTSSARWTWPRAARPMARGYTSFIRRTIAIVSPLRRATDAGNRIRSSAGMPPRTARPPGRAARTANCTASSVPAISNAVSTPSPARSAAGSATSWAPASRAASRRCGSGSTAITRAAPAARKSWTISKPIGPHPITAHVQPIRG